METKCKNCKHFAEIANTNETGQGLCTNSISYFPTTLDTVCVFLPAPLTCKDCDRFDNDMACMTVDADDFVVRENGSLCCGWIDKHEVAIKEALYDWSNRGYDITQKLTDLVDEFAQEYHYPFEEKE